MSMNVTQTANQTIQPMLIGAKAAAAALGFSARKLWELTVAGEIPHIRVGRRVLYAPPDLRVWIEQQKRGGPMPRK